MDEFKRQMWVTWVGAIGLKKVDLYQFLRVLEIIRAARPGNRP